MIKSSTVLTMGLAFTVGMVLGLMINVPGTAHREPEYGGGMRHLNVHKRSVDHERRDVFTANSSKQGEYIPKSGSREPSAMFIQHIKNESAESRINTGNNNRQIRKTNSKQSVATNKQIWRIKQAKIATLNSYDKESGVERTGVINLTRSRSGELSRRKTSRGDDGHIIKPDGIRRHPSTQQRLSQSSTYSHKNGRAINKLEDDGEKIVNTDSNMADIMLTRFTNLGDIVHGVYWSPTIESRLPNLTDKVDDDWSKFARKSKIVNMEEGCGRMQNRLITFKDSSKACARYRINTDQIQGDYFSFLLSLMLGLDNVPKSVLSRADFKNTQWKTVGSNIVGAQWNADKLLILSEWVSDLTSVYIPQELRDEKTSLFPSNELKTRTLGELTELAQFSDLVLFDYLTGNLDRVVNNMFNKQWNRRMMEGPVHNLEKTSTQGKLIFLDNESGLFHSYRLLDRYQHFHDKLLNSLCIFRSQTIDAITTLQKDKNLRNSMMELFRQREPELYNLLPKIPEYNIQVLQQRMQQVLEHVAACAMKYGAESLHQ